MVVNSTGFSGKPLDVLVALDRQGRIVGARIREQHEPILVIGVRPEDLDAFVARYVGHRVDEPLIVSRRARSAREIDAIHGATVSSLVMHNAILTAARAVAASRGVLEVGRVDIARFEPRDFQQLVAGGELAHRRWTVGEIDGLLAARGGRVFPPGSAEDLFLELYLALATPATIGRNLLGGHLYERLMAELRPGDQLLFVAGRGRWSFRGLEWRRSGVFDRIRLVQGDATIALGREDYRPVEKLALADAPELREIAVFRIPHGTGFDPAQPFRLQVRVDGRDVEGRAVSAIVALAYRIPARYLRRGPDVQPAPPWREVWRARRVDVAILLAALALLTIVLFAQDRVARSRRLHHRLRTGFLLFTLIWLGWYASAQLSVINVLTFMRSLLTGFRWDFFLLEPLIFVLWSYVAVALVFWGRGVYCGWLCPFGALQELLHLAARRLRLPPVELPFGLHEGLRTVKFVIFLAIFAVSLGSMEQAQTLVEVEPFKTAIVLRFAREPRFLFYVFVLLSLAVFIPRFYCRYLCPLGAALALPARGRQFEWLRRRRQCGSECRICQLQCPVGAIQPEGHIHPGECIYCLECQVNYYDDGLCPPLIQRRQRAERRAAMARAAREARRRDAADTLAPDAGRG